MAKRCANSIDTYGQLSRCKMENILCCIYPKEKCPNFVEKNFVGKKFIEKKFKKRAG